MFAGVLAHHAHFYPRSPCGERRLLRKYHIIDRAFLSTLSLRRATFWGSDSLSSKYISIHALLAESDERADSLAHAPPKISIHALLAESDIGDIKNTSLYKLFLSTLSLRRATTGTTSAKMQRWDFYPRSPCGERRRRLWLLAQTAPFLSTLSLRRATVTCGRYCKRY